MFELLSEKKSYTFELVPEHQQKSYYGKAYVLVERLSETESEFTLFSYNTRICSYNQKTDRYTRFWDGYSATTMKHINSFNRIFALNVGGKKWWDNLPVNTPLNREQLISAEKKVLK